ncbi:S-adenosylmethionine synthase [Geodia barretti]|uniref:S-adenosylmethionine synthase n=1 Tax=Geodia barretti TaxID=519541 RepID=A0AA35RJH8_GEOBA|nr:S-adenosylmethionine synthase [Geodia barretti]
MPIRFMTSPKYLLTSESVTEGHPDKVCDQISDAVLDAAFSVDPMSRVACETVAGKNLIMITGEITTAADLDFDAIARETLREIGYTDLKYGIDGNSCGIIRNASRQSPDINAGVSTALEARSNGSGADARRATGAGDQGMMVGFACNETDGLMPLTVDLSHRLVERLAAVRKDGTLPYLGPDGKSQITVEYRYGKPHRVDAVVISSQHDDTDDREGFTAKIRADVIEHVIKPIVPAELLDADTKYFVNPSGWFVVGGPQGDSGLTGRKILVDTYGGIARHGGGAFSGKDPTKVDRSGAYAARYVAKNLVAAGFADRLEVLVSYAIGVAEPTSVAVETFDTNHIPNERIEELVSEHFDLRPGAIIEDLQLRQPIYRKTAAYGHFGRKDLDLPWERTDKAEALKQAAGAVATAGD